MVRGLSGEFTIIQLHRPHAVGDLEDNGVQDGPEKVIVPGDARASGLGSDVALFQAAQTFPCRGHGLALAAGAPGRAKCIVRVIISTTHSPVCYPRELRCH